MKLSTTLISLNEVRHTFDSSHTECSQAEVTLFSHKHPTAGQTDHKFVELLPVLAGCNPAAAQLLQVLVEQSPVAQLELHHRQVQRHLHRQDLETLGTHNPQYMKQVAQDNLVGSLGIVHTLLELLVHSQVQADHN